MNRKTIYRHSFSLQKPQSRFFIFANRKLWKYLVQVFLVGFSSFLVSDYTSLAPTLHIIEWKGSCKDLLFVHLFFKSDNFSQVIFRGGVWVNEITRNCGAYHEIPPFVPELFVYSHMSNDSLLSGKTISSGKGIEEIYFRRNRMDRQFQRFDDSRWNSVVSV